MRTAVSLALLLGVLGAGTAGAAYLLQRRAAPAGKPTSPAPSTGTTSPAAPTVPSTSAPTLPPTSTAPILLPTPVLPPASTVPSRPPITTMPVAPVPAVLAPTPAVVAPVWQLAGSTAVLKYASDSILARLREPGQQWPGGGTFDERFPFPIFNR